MMPLILLPSWLREENVQERKVLVTYEAIYDIVEAEEYINNKFGNKRAREYRADIKGELKKLTTEAHCYGTTGFEYRKYVIYKKPYPPSIIFWIIKENEVHILRVPRERYDWQGFFQNHTDYEYTYPD